MGAPLLDAHTVIVTGAGQGNGAALAEGLARLGAHVLATDLRVEAAMRTAERIRAAGGHGEAHALDVTRAEACAALAASLAVPEGHRLVLVNNAGIRPRHAFDGAERDQAWRDAMAVNVDGVRHMVLAFEPLLRATGGNVVNISSISASRASPGGIAYSPSKAAAEMLTKVLALELASAGIRVNAVAPGLIETGIHASGGEPGRVARLAPGVPMQRGGTPDEVARAVLWLLSDEASYTTGAILDVAGGR